LGSGTIEQALLDFAAHARLDRFAARSPTPSPPMAASWNVKTDAGGVAATVNRREDVAPGSDQ
jgi:hypothetical protein